jgi:putative addiction module component (TIGR02574 family)
MTLQFEKIQKEIHSLTNREKAALAYRLIEDLDGPPDEGVEQLWIEEAQRRYEAYRSGNLEAIPGDEVMRRARERLK